MISVIVPVYNSAPTLNELVLRLEQALAPESPFEIILINDGSRDNSWAVISQLAEHNQRVTGINLMRNYGQHNALLCGIRGAVGEIIVTLDDDLQNPPEEIPLLLEKLAQGYDVIYGSPATERHGLWRVLASQVTKIVLQQSMGADTAVKISSFRSFRTSLRDGFINFQNPYVNIDVMLTWATTRFAVIAVRHDPRRVGISNYTVSRLITHALNMITGFSAAPLRVATLTGLAFSLFGSLVFVYVVGRFLLEGDPVAGFPFLASTIAIFSGVQLFALGVMGEYLARLHFRLMDRPTYVVRERIASQHD